METGAGNVNGFHVDRCCADIRNSEGLRIFLADDHRFEIDDGRCDRERCRRIFRCSGGSAARGKCRERADAKQREQITVTNRGVAA